MTLPRIHIGRPQRLAALLLLAFFAECLWVVAHQPHSLAIQHAINGDGIFAYSIVKLSFAVLRLVHCNSPRATIFLLHLPFVFFAVWMGGGLFALALYCFCPTVVSLAVVPNDDLLAMWGLYGLVYTAIGVSHAMLGPRRKWRPRIALLTLALGLTAAAHLVAGIAGLIAALCFMLYLAEGRRIVALQILFMAAIGAFAILFAFSGFHPAELRHALSGAVCLSLISIRSFASDLSNLPILIATAVATLLYLFCRRSRYFGNTAPLLIVLALAPLIQPQAESASWVWALPFFFTFLGGVFADALETRTRNPFLALTGAILAAQAILCLAAL